MFLYTSSQFLLCKGVNKVARYMLNMFFVLSLLCRIEIVYFFLVGGGGVIWILNIFTEQCG
jgi:hypothetical protein